MISEDRKLMDLKDLKRLSEGIVMPSNKVDNMFQECQLKYGKRKRFKKKMRIISISIVGVIFCICLGMYMKQPEVSVYASTSTANVKLQENQQIVLAKQSTPMGWGYKLEIQMSSEEYIYTVTDENSQYPQNIFHKGNEIYWFPDGLGTNLRDSKGTIIELPEIDQTVITIQILQNKNIKETFQLCLEKKGDTCSVTLEKEAK